ncbi:putative origin recognition complex subunit, partial [Toxoplasma gondii VAND]
MAALSPQLQRRPSAPASSSPSSSPSPCSTPGCEGTCMRCSPSLSQVLNLRFSDGSFLLSHLHSLLRHRLHLASRGFLHSPLPLSLLVASSSSSFSSSAPSSSSASSSAASSALPPSLSRLEASLESTASPLQRWRKQATHASPRKETGRETGTETGTETPRREEPPPPHSVEAVALELSRKLSCCLQLKEKTSVLLLGPPGSGKTTALELALNTVQRLAREQREQQASLHFNRENRDDLKSKKAETRDKDASASFSDYASSCVSSPLRPARPSSLSSLSSSPPSLLSSGLSSSSLSSSPPALLSSSPPSLLSSSSPASLAPAALLPDLLVVRLSCPLYRDDASLLHAIVSQLGRDLRCQKTPAASASVEELSHTLRLILEDSCSLFGRAVVIVLDRFERCCLDASGERRRQQLLYNLFDLQHSSDLQICTVCVSAVLDITQHMEKRIRSRFSLQTLYVAGPSSLPRFTAFLRRNLLRVSSPLLLRTAVEAARRETSFCAALAGAARAREEEVREREAWRGKRRKGVETRAAEEEAALALLLEPAWTPTAEDLWRAEVFARAFAAALEEEFTSQRFRVRGARGARSARTERK